MRKTELASSWWEFLPGKIFYAPLLVYIFWLCVRFRTTPAALVRADPALPYGGLSIGSKYVALEQFNTSSHAKSMIAKGTLLLTSSSTAARMRQATSFARRVGYPLIAKPDYGHRGIGVVLVHSRKDLKTLVKSMPIDYILQEYYDFPCEFGIFYVRMPDEKKGRIVGITQKILPEVTGDGRRTLHELIVRSRLPMNRQKKLIHKNDRILDTVLPKGECKKLIVTGSHAQGALFLDGMNMHTRALERTFSRVCDPVVGFHFGRFDCKVQSIASLRKGKCIRIVEINGIDSEHTHIYDPKYSLRFAYATLFVQWKLVFTLAQQNKHLKKAPLREMFLRYRAVLRALDTIARR